MSVKDEKIRNFKPAMAYRRFGADGPMLSVITLGGMRFVKGGQTPRDHVPPEMIAQATDVVREALDRGINHIETAYGYGRSERCYGRVLNRELQVPRNRYHLMTKGAPESADRVRGLIEEQLEALQTDHFDFYAWHGINNPERFAVACAPGGPVEQLLKLKEEGLIGRVGFSTHGPLETISESIDTGLFDFVNLHYYYFFQRNRPAVERAHQRGMGVFIISPNDKGGQLFNAPALLRTTTAPLTPIQFNARFCLSSPTVQTLAFGMTEMSHFAEMAGVVEHGSVPWDSQEREIKTTLDKRRNLDPYSGYTGYDIADSRSGINIPEVLRFRTLWKCYEMEAFCKYRYNMLEEKGHWFPGTYCTRRAVAKIDPSIIPPGIPLQELLIEFHKRFYSPKGAIKRIAGRFPRLVKKVKPLLYPLYKRLFKGSRFAGRAVVY